MKVILPSDEHIEQLIIGKEIQSEQQQQCDLGRVGPGTTTIKRDKNRDERRAFCRGYMVF